MNTVNLIGRLVRDAEVRYSQGENPTAIARVTLAVDRPFAKEGQQQADFINCKAFGKMGEFLEKYGMKGTKFGVVGRIETGSYQNKNNETIYTTEVVVEKIEFAESKKSNSDSGDREEFANIPVEEEEDLPFK